MEIIITHSRQKEMGQKQDVFVLDFLSGQLHYLEVGTIYVTGDYYMEAREKNDGISLLVLYAPEREMKESTTKDHKRLK